MVAETKVYLERGPSSTLWKLPDYASSLNSWPSGTKWSVAIMTEIHIEIASVTAKPPLRALADVTLRWPEGELTIRRCAVFEKNGEQIWASLPRLLIEKDGKRHFAPLIELPRELRERVLDAVLAEYRRKIDVR